MNKELAATNGQPPAEAYKDPHSPAFLTVNEVADICDVSVRAVTAWVKQGKLRKQKPMLESSFRFALEDVIAFLDNRQN